MMLLINCKINTLWGIVAKLSNYISINYKNIYVLGVRHIFKNIYLEAKKLNESNTEKQRCALQFPERHGKLASGII